MDNNITPTKKRRPPFPKARTSLIIYNPVSGVWQNKNNLFDLIMSISERGEGSIVKMTTAKGDAQKIVRQYGPYVDRIICCGGDGTLHEAIEGLYTAGLHVPIGYIPIGTTNDFAATLDIPFDFHAACENTLQGRPCPLDIGTIKGRTGTAGIGTPASDGSEVRTLSAVPDAGSRVVFDYIACFGIFTRTSYETDQALKNTIGYLAYLLNGVTELAALGNPIRMRVESSSRLFDQDFCFGAVVNSYTVAHFFKLPQEEVNLADGEFEVLLINQPQNIFEAHDTAQAILSGDYANPRIHFFHSDKIRFVSDDPVKWCADGEFAGEFTDVEVENHNHAVDIILSDHDNWEETEE